MIRNMILNYLFLPKAEITSITHYYMVRDIYSDNIERLAKAPGHFNIVQGRFRVSAGMIMQKYN
jgi:hypothetical protein